ncbi:hypothetical protein D3C85_953190 [compost metagenome]
MNFLGCDGLWSLQVDGTTICDGQLKTYTVQEMRDYLTPALTWEQKTEITGAMLVLLACVWVGKKLRTSIPH